MQNETVTQKTIDVVEDFSFPYQNTVYQEKFRLWRRRKENPYAFRFTRNPKESAFSESRAAGAQSPSQAEQLVLHRIGCLTGYVVIGYLVIENIFDKIIVCIMNALHFNIEMVFSGESRLYGDEKLIFWLSFLTDFLKYLIPVLVMQFMLKLPVQVSMPVHIRKPAQLLGGISLAMLLSVGFGIFGIFHSSELEKYRMISGMTNNDGSGIMLYILIMIFGLPVIAELLLHGCLFQVLRQFGDMFAVIATAVLAVTLTHNVWDILRVGLVHLTISYYVIQTGSFCSAIFIRIVHEIYMFALFCMEMYDAVYSPEWFLMLLVPFVLGGCVCTSMLLKKKRPDESIPDNVTYLKMLEKLTVFFTTMPMIGFLICFVLLLVITTMLT